MTILRKTLTIILCASFSFVFGQEYKLGADSQFNPDVPKGKVTKHTWESKIYDNTWREYYVYVPAQYDPEEPAALMVFQDGHNYVKEDGSFRVPIVFDNLIAKGEMPVTIALFVNPGHRKSLSPHDQPWASENRPREYDEVTDLYATFLIEEMIPEIEKDYNLTNDPKQRAICGISSGGICAFTAAWFRPDYFQKVLSHIGSFTDIRGGYVYPNLIRKSSKRDIKVFLQDGSGDLDNVFGNWWLANQQMAAALKYKGYDYKFVGGTEGHNGTHGGAIFPESLKWLWADNEPVASIVYDFDKLPSEQLETRERKQLFEGTSRDLAYVEMHTSTVPGGQMPHPSHKHGDTEELIIIKEGKIKVTIDGKSKVMGPGSVAMAMPGDEHGLQNVGKTPATYYIMKLQSSQPMDQERGEKAGGSFMIDFKDLEYKPHDRGGIRNYYNRPTAMARYFEMHVTTLKAGIKSHEPHTHRAAEIVLMIEGNTQMQIGDKFYDGTAGDVYFLESDVSHAIENVGDKPCMYFAFQWE